MDRHEALAEAVNRVPAGRVASYGTIGRTILPPTTGRIIGQWMFRAPVDAEMVWWRIINSRGELPIAKRDPKLAVEQRRKLEEEGVEFSQSGLVKREFFISPEELFD